MWTETPRAQYRRARLVYASDTREAEWPRLLRCCRRRRSAGGRGRWHLRAISTPSSMSLEPVSGAPCERFPKALTGQRTTRHAIEADPRCHVWWRAPERRGLARQGAH